MAQTPGGTTTPPSATPVAIPAPYTNTTINYIRTWEPAVATTDTAYVGAAARTADQVRQTTQYFDGLGRLIQTVVKGISYSGNDMVTPIVFDQYGREQVKYLPYASQNTTDGKFKTDPFNAQKTFYQTQVPGAAGESIYYNRLDFEASPLNRVLKTYAPGNNWAKNDPAGVEKGGNRPLENQSLINTAADSVRIWDLSNVIPTSTPNRIYAEGQLYKNVLIDEAGNQVVEFKDKNGVIILKKAQFASAGTLGTAHMGWLCTYYVYDDFGNLCFVIPPKAVQSIIGTNWTISIAIAAELCFIYRYDDRNRMIIKKVAGADSTEMVYDVRDRLVFSRDGNMKRKTWLATFYDGQNRQIMTALYKNATATRESLQIALNGVSGSSSQNIIYNFPAPVDLILDNFDQKPLYQAINSIVLVDGFETSTGAATEMVINPTATSGNGTIVANTTLANIPADSLTPLTYTYYDDYSFSGAQNYASSDITKPQADGSPNAEPLPAVRSNQVTGLVTGTKVRVLGTQQWLTTTNCYNDKGRLVQVLADNINGGTDITTSLYDFNGKMLSSYLRHKNLHSDLSPQTTVLTMLRYDPAGRITSIKKRLNDANASQDKTIAVNTYDELGQLKTKRLGVAGSTQLETLTYDYNIRGWLTGINKTYASTVNSTANWFGQTLAYDAGFTIPQYNGNVAGTTWKSKSDGIARAYGYNYDKVNRLVSAPFTQQNSGSSNWTIDQKDFSVSNLNYDANGNIMTMNQMGMIGTTKTMIDVLTYSYQSASNKLAAVGDVANTTSVKLGDFINGTNTGDDYDYDANGNMIKDLNKNITTITYNHLNQPDSIVITGKGRIKFLYDAAGVNWRKIITDQTGSADKVVTTDYIGGFVYQNDTLQFLAHEEGRIRPVFKTGQAAQYPFDYFVKDHLENVRLVLTDQSDFTTYTATMEVPAAPKETALFSNIDNTRTDKPVGYPADESAGKNASVAKLTATGTGKKIGPSIVLRVMAGDTVQLSAKAFYKSDGPKDNKSATATAENMIAGLVQAFGGNAQSNNNTHGNTLSDQQTPFNSSFYNNDYRRLKEKEPDQPNTNRPKAYLNFVLFDDGFKLVEENSGVKQVKAAPDELQTLGQDKMVIKKTGFLYAYTSNESAQPVYFDNVILGVNAGPLLEETHYYPFGLTMAGISSNALKGTNYPENKKRFTSQELEDRLDLNWYQFKYRSMDPQIGRFIQIDPLSSKYASNTPFAYAENKVTMGIDLEGLELAPANSAWFKAAVSYQAIYGTNATTQHGRVDIASDKVPSVFKDAAGVPLFSAASVGVTPSGSVSSPSGPILRPDNNLPGIPGWAWGSVDPEPPGNTGGWRMGNDLDKNKVFSDQGSSVAFSPQEGHAWVVTFRDNVPLWKANAALKDNINNFNTAASLSSDVFGSPRQKADVTNFVNDGSLPGLNLRDFRGSLQRGIGIMEAGMKIMNKNGIDVKEATQKTYDLYRTLLELLKKNDNKNTLNVNLN
ncbi:DUF6443 domain-containing protein [Chitinophaga eiseniae]|uniref:DUF6443 domain-containing protein n=1 Tax=Chitinophaga eiseniae TaxID=634771 RepID=A0A847SDT6_9BACT|nr:DUF6443 domain-containing protein [Chitinophaga eiseniae]NLR79971.1 hypothetical protein [Chitinophaga eiseniae]